MIIFLKLIFGHALADYPLQQEFLAVGKAQGWPGIHRIYCLFWHSLIHAGFVLYITNNLYFAGFELIIHMIIDELKVRKITNYEVDQLLHIICKILYVVKI